MFAWENPKQQRNIKQYHMDTFAKKCGIRFKFVFPLQCLVLILVPMVFSMFFDNLTLLSVVSQRLFCVKSDMIRIKKMKRKMSAEGKRIRKRKRAQNKGFAVRDEEEEDEVYASGLF